MGEELWQGFPENVATILWPAMFFKLWNHWSLALGYVGCTIGLGRDCLLYRLWQNNEKKKVVYNFEVICGLCWSRSCIFLNLLGSGPLYLLKGHNLYELDCQPLPSPDMLVVLHWGRANKPITGSLFYDMSCPANCPCYDEDGGENILWNVELLRIQKRPRELKYEWCIGKGRTKMQAYLVVTGRRVKVDVGVKSLLQHYSFYRFWYLD